VTATFPAVRSTSAAVTPSSFFSAPSTDALQCPHVMPCTFNVVSIVYSPPLNETLYFYNLTLFNRSAFVTTLTELNAIAAPATQGASNPIAAIGIPAVL